MCAAWHVRLRQYYTPPATSDGGGWQPAQEESLRHVAPTMETGNTSPPRKESSSGSEKENKYVTHFKNTKKNIKDIIGNPFRKKWGIWARRERYPLFKMLKQFKFKVLVFHIIKIMVSLYTIPSPFVVKNVKAV